MNQSKPRLSALAQRLDALRQEKRQLELDISTTTQEIIEEMGLGCETLTEDYLIKTMKIHRQVFDKDAFFQLYGEAAYPSVTKPSSFDQVFLRSAEVV